MDKALTGHAVSQTAVFITDCGTKP